MRGWLALAAALLGSLPAAAGFATVYDLTVIGETDNTNVVGGDACGTGMTGPNACNGQTIVVEWHVDADAASADQDPSPTKGFYSADAEVLFLAADVTIHGVPFSFLATSTPSRTQTVQIWDDLDTAGITDRILLELVGGDGSGQSSSLTSSVNLGPVFGGDSLDVLGTTYSGPVVFGGASFFTLANELGTVGGQYVVSSVTFAAPEPGAAERLASVVAALAALSRSARAASRP